MSSKTRNYHAMGNEKLLKVIAQLQCVGSDAWDRAVYQHSGNADYELGIALDEARERGYSNNELRQAGVRV